MKKSLLAAVLLCACVAGSRLRSGERLIQNLPSADQGWTSSATEDGNEKQFMWTNSSGVPAMLVTILPGQLGHFHESLYDAAVRSGQTQCTKHTIERIAEQQLYGYPMILWYKTCELKTGGSTFVLSKALSGTDSFYLIQRSWRETPDEADLALWREALEQTYICDTRRSDAPCPTDPGTAQPGLSF